jgi:aryl-alcohol dehydrogenase-like predicted oxidoreductase
MERRALGRSGLAVSRLALGTMTWGRDTDADDAAAQLKTFRKAGLRPGTPRRRRDGSRAHLLRALDTTLCLQVALAWVGDRPGVVAAVLGTRTVGQLLGALQSDGVHLPAEIRSALDDVSAPVSGYPEDSGGWCTRTEP